MPMNRRALLSMHFLCVLFLSSVAFGQQAPRTMRLDYYHTGNDTQELFSLDRVVVEPLAWPGNPRKTIDETNLGKYSFEVRDLDTNRILYSRGFASIYGEWETTAEAKKINRTFNESLRFPAPQGRAQVLVKKRDAANAFREIWSVIVDPKDMFVDSSRPASPGPLIEFQKSGDPAGKVDFLILCDGYTAAERSKFERDARRLLEILFSTTPYKEHRADFNGVYARLQPSPGSPARLPKSTSLLPW